MLSKFPPYISPANSWILTQSAIVKESNKFRLDNLLENFSIIFEIFSDFIFSILLLICLDIFVFLLFIVNSKPNIEKNDFNFSKVNSFSLISLLFKGFLNMS